MSPLIKKASFRISKLKRPPIFGGREKGIFTKEFKRWAVAVFFVVLAIGIIYSGKLPTRIRLSEGDIATEDIYAPFDFNYVSGIDVESTENLKKEALATVSDIYSIDHRIPEEEKIEAGRFFDKLKSIKEPERELTDTDVEDLNAGLVQALTIGDIKELLTYPDMDFLKNRAIGILAELYSYPIISTELKDSLKTSGADYVDIYQKDTDKISREPLSELYDISRADKLMTDLISRSDIAPRKIKSIFGRLLPNWLKPDLSFNQQETESAKKSALSSVVPVYNMLERKKGESVIRRGQRVTKEHLLQLDKISASYVKEDIFSQFWGILALMGILIFLLLTYLRYFQPRIFYQDKLLLLIGLCLIFIVILSRLVVSSPLSSYFIPVASISILLTILVSGSVAAITTVAACIIAALITGAKFNILMVSVVGGITGICTVYGARHRGQIIKSGLYVGILNFVAICALGILSNLGFNIYLKEGVWGIANGITSAAIAMVFLPFLESAFKITTDIKLLELTDLNHPLLKEMVMKAPGTYHHSVVVGNLAEAACDAIGANPLLARVGSYYHDIGKIQKPEYFSENQQESLDTHSKLSPSMSSLIITNHVKEGVELAEKYKLGTAIKDFIEQHHGTGLVTYFYHQALEKTEKEKPVSDEGFRYPGPKPQTKEAAVVMLADSVEAASRTLQNPTPQRLKELVRKIINNKFIERQLDDCELTLKDVNKIADSFVRILTGIYHSRVEYPKTPSGKYAGNNTKQSK